MLSNQKTAAQISFAISLFVLALKFTAYFNTSSTAILSDALETIVNVVTAVVALIVLKFALQPADKEHPYGHGKLEYFSAAFEGGIILFAGLAIIFESIRSYIVGNSPHNLEVGLFFMVLASLVNALAALYLKQVGIKQNSETLKASAAHLMADVKTTAGVLIGLGIYEVTGLKWIDPLVGVLVGIWLATESVGIIRRNIGGLLDETDLKSVGALAEKISIYVSPEIIDIHNLKIIRSGSFHHIDAHLVVPQFLEIHEVHELIHSFEKNVVSDYKFDGEFAFHTDPCYQKYCSVCEVQQCPLRKSAFKSRRKFDEEHLISGPQYTEN